MKKALLLMIAALFALSVTGQPVTKKAQVTGSQKLQELEKVQNLLVTAQKLDSTITESSDESSWVFSNRIRYSYSVLGFTTTTTSQKNLSATGNAWVNQDQTETTVDGLGNTTQNVDYTWSGSAWVGSMKKEYVFVDNNLTKSSTYQWNNSTNLWDGLGKTEYAYTSGKVTEDIGYVWDNALSTPDWVYSRKIDYTYTGSDLTSVLSWDWDPIGSSWVPSGKAVYTYSGGFMITATSSWWDTDLSDWVNSSKSEYTYTGGKQTLVLISSWGGSAWVNEDKIESEYNDPDGRITLYSYYGWNGAAWFGYTWNETSYGIQGALNYSVTIYSAWDFINSQWSTPYLKSTKWYSDVVTGIDLNKTTGTKISVYPNPVKEYVVFNNVNISESATVAIFDIRGRKVMEKQLSGNNQLVINNLRKGLYIYKLSNNGLTYSGKLLKD
jgi:hypothetical protein